MKKVILLNYLACKTVQDRIKLDNDFYDLEDFIVHGKKLWNPTYKRRNINGRLFGFNININYN